MLFIYHNGAYTGYHITICSITSGNHNKLLNDLKQKYFQDFTGKKYKLVFMDWLNPKKPGSIKVFNQNLENIRKDIFTNVQNNNNYQIDTSRYPSEKNYHILYFFKLYLQIPLIFCNIFIIIISSDVSDRHNLV